MADFESMPREEWDNKLQSAGDLHFGTYMKAVTDVIRSSLLNLELIAWYDRPRISPSTVKALLESQMTHMKLDRVSVDHQSVRVMEKMPLSRVCRLATLDLSVLGSFHKDPSPEEESNAVYGFVAYMLRLGAPTLTTLRWEDVGSLRTPGTKESLPKPSNLRKLSLRHLAIDTQADLEALILPNPYCKPVHLELYFPSGATTKFINDRGSMHTLKTFVWTGRENEGEQMLAFLEANPQLETLSLDHFPVSLIESKLLPLLVERFQSLTSLELAFAQETTTLPQCTYKAIAQLKSLEQLCLQAGNQWGWKRTWLIDHEALRTCIKRLPTLKRLAFSGDTYLRREFQGDAFEHYYSMKYFNPQSDLERRLKRVALFTIHDDDARHDDDGNGNNNDNEGAGSDADEPLQTPLQKRLDWAWEMAHRQKMLRQATKYVDLRYRGGPKLEFLYIGQLPMQVKLGWYGWRAHAVTNGRESGWTMLQRMFKGTGDLFSDK